MESTAEAPVAAQPVETTPAAAPMTTVVEQAPIGVVDRLRSVISSLNPFKQVAEAEHQVELARDPSS